jgi:hypothetical protein
MIYSKVTKEMIKPGHTLTVIGKHGTGRWFFTRQAIVELGLVPYECEVLTSSHLDFLGLSNTDENMVWNMKDYSITSFKNFAKSIPGNGVLVVQNIERMQPMFVASILEQMFNPDRSMVLIGSDFDYMSILLRSTVVKL